MRNKIKVKSTKHMYTSSDCELDSHIILWLLYYACLCCKKTTQTHHQHQLGHIIELKILNLVQLRDISFFYNIYCCSFATNFEFWFNSLRAILCAIFANFIMFLFNNHIQSGAKSNQIAKKTQNAPNINAHKNYALEPRDVIRSNPMHLIIYF